MANKKELYLKGIRLITDYFSAQGIDIKIGFEVEFLAPRLPDADGKKFFGEIPEKSGPHNHSIPSDRLPAYTELLRGKMGREEGEQSGIIKTMAEVPVDKYEVVMCPMDPDGAIASAETVKTTILEEIRPELKEKGWAERVSFGSYEGRVMPALHANIGMTMNGTDMFKESDVVPTNFMLSMAQAMKKAIHETTALIAPFPSSYERYRSDAHKSYPKTVAVNEEYWNKDGKSIVLKNREVRSDHCMFPDGGEGSHDYVHWIENRLPSGDCQPYVAAFTTLLAAYDAFQKVVKFDDQGKAIQHGGEVELKGDAMVQRKDYNISKDFQSAKRVFTAGETLQKRMNDLDPEGQLGNDLHNMEKDNQTKVTRKERSLPKEERPSLGALRS